MRNGNEYCKKNTFANGEPVKGEWDIGIKEHSTEKDGIMVHESIITQQNPKEILS